MFHKNRQKTKKVFFPWPRGWPVVRPRTFGRGRRLMIAFSAVCLFLGSRTRKIKRVNKLGWVESKQKSWWGKWHHCPFQGNASSLPLCLNPWRKTRREEILRNRTVSKRMIPIYKSTSYEQSWIHLLAVRRRSYFYGFYCHWTRNYLLLSRGQFLSFCLWFKSAHVSFCFRAIKYSRFQHPDSSSKATVFPSCFCTWELSHRAVWQWMWALQKKCTHNPSQSTNFFLRPHSKLQILLIYSISWQIYFLDIIVYFFCLRLVSVIRS